MCSLLRVFLDTFFVSFIAAMHILFRTFDLPLKRPLPLFLSSCLPSCTARGVPHQV